jgi:YfiH family protein
VYASRLVDTPRLFLVARSLPVRHGFSLRTGGVSTGERASLDLGPAVDLPVDARENRERLAREAGLDPNRLVTAHQVHGARVVRARDGDVVEADCLWTDAAGSWVGIRTADCVPLLLADVLGTRVAAVHSGWRGAEARIAAAAVSALAAEGTSPAQLRAAIGPCIGRCCYEVGEDLAERFGHAFGDSVIDRNSARRPHLDLRQAVRLTLRAAGMAEEAIEDVPGCTACQPEAFFSHRRDRGRTGRHLAFVAPGALS